MNSKPKPEPDPIERTEEWMPSPETLATVAAMLSQQTGAAPGIAVKKAFELCMEAKAKLVDVMTVDFLKASYADILEDEDELKDWPKIDAYPATFKTFLQVVVKGRTNADKEILFRKFVEATEPDMDVDKYIKLLHENGLKSAHDWFALALPYATWRIEDKSEKAALAGKLTPHHKPKKSP